MRQELFKKRVTVLLVNEDKLRVLMPAHGAQEWTLEKQETEQVTFRLADTLLKLRPLTNNSCLLSQLSYRQ